MDRLNDSLQREIKELKSEITSFKSAQPLGGDSWLVNRYSGSFTIPAGSLRWLKFKPKLPQYHTVLMTYQKDITGDTFDSTTETVLHKFGDSYYLAFRNITGISHTVRYLLLSTQEGTVTIQSTNPY